MKMIKSFDLWLFMTIAASVVTAGIILGGCATAPRPSIFPTPTYQRLVNASTDADEVWILSRNPEAMPTDQNNPGSGSLMAELPEKEVPLPLAHTDVKASVSGSISTVDVTQQFNNPYDHKIEAVYVFPLPHNAAVNEFIMTIGKRRIRGIIRERKDAERIYEEAKRQGYAATLLTEERPNIFRQSVANIEPSNEIDVNIKYFSSLDYVDGWYEFVFPMVVGPPFNPAGTDVPDITYVKPNERSGNDISLRVDVDAVVPVKQIECKTHAITKSVVSPEHFTVQLKPDDTIPNKDFVLRYRVAADKIQSSLITQRDARGNYFALTLYPPEELGNLPREPVELVFVLDCSRNMSGRPFEQAKAAIEHGLRLLQPGDSFQLITFSSTASELGPAPVEATPENVQRGLNYLHSLVAGDNAMMLEGVKAALDFPHDPNRLRFVCFLTDGHLGNESDILGETHRRLGDSRIFSFGVGSSANRYLLDRMATDGRGAVAYLGPHDNAAQIMEDFFQRISHPALTNIRIDWGAMQVSEVSPREIPDLFPGRCVVLTGRFAGTGSTAIRVTGSAGSAPLQFDIRPNLSNAATIDNGIPSVWARMKIADLIDQSTYDSDTQLVYQIRQVALDYGLYSPFTACIAVDASQKTERTDNSTVSAPEPAPDEGNNNGAQPDK